MSNLYSISNNYLHIMGMLEDSEGEFTEEIEKELELLNESKDEFITSMCQEITNLNGDIVQINTEVERLAERKKNAVKKIETSKAMIIKVLRFFGMRSPNKKSPGYAFKTSLFSGYTRSSESVQVDEMALSTKFVPITGKQSAYVDYMITAKVTHNDLIKLNELGIIPITAYTPTVDKKSVKIYLESVAQSHEHSSENTDGLVADILAQATDKTDEVKLDPIADYASITVKESLIIK